MAKNGARILVDACNIKYIKITNDFEIEKCLNEALSSKQAVIVDINIDYSKIPHFLIGVNKAILRSMPIIKKSKLVLKRTYKQLF